MSVNVKALTEMVFNSPTAIDIGEPNVKTF
jgi:hypothetical protein